jgi:hypothetical protein
MHNPLALLDPVLLKALLQEPKLLVRQYYARGLDTFDNADTIPLLLTYYYKNDSVAVNRCGFHLQQLQQDKYRFLYDSENPAHLEKLICAAQQPAGYKVFINLLPRRWSPPDSLKRKIHQYMLQHLPWWNYNKTYQLHIQLTDRYGKLYLQLHWKGNKADVLLEEIDG